MAYGDLLIAITAAEEGVTCPALHKRGDRPVHRSRHDQCGEGGCHKQGFLPGHRQDNKVVAPPASRRSNATIQRTVRGLETPQEIGESLQQRVGGELLASDGVNILA